MKEELKEKVGTTVTETAGECMDTFKEEAILPVAKALAIKFKDYAIEKMNNIGKSNKVVLKSKKGHVFITSRGILRTKHK